LPGLNSPSTGEPFARNTSSGPQWTGKVELIESKLSEPLRWRKPTRCFVNSMSDLFHESLSNETIDRIFAVMALCPHITFQVLTKRAERMREYISGRLNSMGVYRLVMGAHVLSRNSGIVGESHRFPLPNVWLGVSVEDRKNKTRIDQLKKTPAALRFLSLEPLLEDLGELDLRDIGWVIVGGASGPGSWPCNIAWIRSVVRQCKAAQVPVFVKQLGSVPLVFACRQNHFDWGADIHQPAPKFSEWTADREIWRFHPRDRKGGDPSEWPESLRVREMPDRSEVRR
jgi:protein gp37